MITLVALDMAGTTVDEHGDVYTALARGVETSGASVSAEYVQFWMGAEKRHAILELIKAGGGEPDDASVDEAFNVFRSTLADAYATNPPVPLEGVERTLTELRERAVKVALTTGFSHDIADPLLTSLGWSTSPDGILDAVVCSDDVLQGRPAPHMIHRAMEATGILDVRQVVAAGDTVVDLEAASNAGVISVGVLTGKLDRAALARGPHDYIIDGVVDLPRLLDRITER